MNYDVLVIGGGPGGYVAAIRAAQLGLKTACVEMRETLGGTCLNVGCIPSKALLDSSEHYAQAKSGLQKHGVVVEQVNFNLETMMKRKKSVVGSLTQGVEGLFKKNGVTWLKGQARLTGSNNVEIKTPDQTETVSAKNIILATGSTWIDLPFIKVDEKRIVSSTGALSFDEVPEHLVVIGGGAIGLELGSVWLRLGAKVTVIEFMDRLAPTMDKQVSRELKRVLSRQGMKFHLSTKVTACEVQDKAVQLKAEDKKGNVLEFSADRALVSIGRRPFHSGLGLEELDIAIDQRGYIQVDSHFQTNVKGVFAIGDVIGGAMLAHKAEDEGIACAELLAGKAGHVNYDAIPAIIYTWPEVAAVGETEESLQEAGIPFAKGTFSFKASARARCMDETDGFVKVLAHSETDRVLGVHIVGPRASDLIAEAVVAMEYKASSEDIARMVHAHPTLSEPIREAAMAVEKRAIHS
ncbi:MAG: dihydrolipoyl dehydrogenase [Acidobacteria bacterium]|nr:MAG: dihydrolipoyl dehydrogenase [Acidobacteriota bacterium]